MPASTTVRPAISLPRWLQKSLLARIVGLLLLISTTPLLVALVQIRWDVTLAEQEEFQRAQPLAHAAAADVEEVVANAEGAARTLARLPAFWNGTDEDRDAILTAIAAGQPVFNALGYFTADLAQHGFSNYEPGTPRASIVSRAYGREVVVTGKPAFTAEVVVGAATGQRILPVAIPVQEAGPAGRSGFLVAGLHLARLSGVWASVPLLPGSHFTLVDMREGRVLMDRPEQEPRNSPFLDAGYLARIRAGETAFRMSSDDRSHDHLSVWAPATWTPWVVVVNIPSEVIFGPIYEIAWERAWLRTSIAMGILVLFSYLIWQVVPRINALYHAAEEWARGNWSHRTDLQTDDEFGLLGQTFDRMAQQVREHDAERARAETAVRTANTELEQFAYTISHDLRAPLTSIQGYADLLSEDFGGVLGEEGRGYLDRISRNAARLGRLINDVLAISRVGRGGFTSEPVDVQAVITHVLDSLRVALDDASAEVSLMTPLPVVAGNRTLLEQIVINLVTNALTYGANTGQSPRIEIAARPKPAGWRISVRDHGPGIPAEQQERVFRLFERLASARIKNPQGTGLGLAIVRKAVETMGGTTGIAAPDDGGALFWFELPAAAGTLVGEYAAPEREVPAVAPPGNVEMVPRPAPAGTGARESGPIPVVN